MTFDLISAFCTIFSLLGAKLLFWSSQPVSFGSVLLTALISLSISHLLAAGDAPVLALDLYNKTTNLACSYSHTFAPLRAACAFIQRDDTHPFPNDATGRFSEM